MRLNNLNPDPSLLNLLAEGGWETKITQDTIITPAVVGSALKAVQSFIKGFNSWLGSKGYQPVSVGHPLGSTAYHANDPEDSRYGDIDLQMIAPEVEGAATPSQFSAHWNGLLDTYISTNSPKGIYDQGKASNGHVIFNLGNNAYVQVDLLWTKPSLSRWMRYRMTPAKGIKGATYGNLFSTLGEIMHLSIQSAGVQMKIKDGTPVPFAKSRKYSSLETLSTDVENFGVDILKALYGRMHPNSTDADMIIDPLLLSNPGVDTNSITAARMVNLIKGLGKSFESNGMFGKFNLRDIANYDQFISAFKSHYMDKIQDAVAATKFDKAESPEAKARAEDTKSKLLSHGTAVMGLF